MSAADFLFTPTVQRVLGLALLNPGKSFTLRELIAHAGKGVGGVQTQVDKLVAAGVLMEEPRRGRQRSIRSNPDFIFYDELKKIAMKSFGVAEPLREALKPYTAQIQDAFVFGSVAKGTDTAQSDIDLMIIGTAPLLELTTRMHDLELQLGRKIHLTVYAQDEWQELVASDPVVTQIAESTKIKLAP